MPLTSDTAAVRRLLETDRPWAAYALADLVPPYRELSEWHIDASGTALVLIYRGLSPTLLFAMGGAREVEPLLAEVAGKRRLYFSVRAEIAALLGGFGYTMESRKRMWRMALDPGRLAPDAAGNAVRLGLADFDALEALYADGAPLGEQPPFFLDSMLVHGVYYGIREGESIVAAAGTHVVALEEGVGGIGNVYTRRDRRGQGFAAQTTAAVAAQLLRRGVRTVALNVDAANAPAIRVYQRLGFALHCEYREGVARRSE